MVAGVDLNVLDLAAVVAELMLGAQVIEVQQEELQQVELRSHFPIRRVDDRLDAYPQHRMKYEFHCCCGKTRNLG